MTYATHEAGDERTATNVDRYIGRKIRMRRLEIDMSQERLAELLGITFQQVQKYEKGINRVASSRLYDVAHALKLPISEFFPRRRGVPADGDEQLIDMLATRDGVDLAIMFERAKPKQRAAILAAVRAIVGGD